MSQEFYHPLPHEFLAAGLPLDAVHPSALFEGVQTVRVPDDFVRSPNGGTYIETVAGLARLPVGLVVERDFSPPGAFGRSVRSPQYVAWHGGLEDLAPEGRGEWPDEVAFREAARIDAADQHAASRDARPVPSVVRMERTATGFRPATPSRDTFTAADQAELRATLRAEEIAATESSTAHEQPRIVRAALGAAALVRSILPWGGGRHAARRHQAPKQVRPVTPIRGSQGPGRHHVGVPRHQIRPRMAHSV